MTNSLFFILFLELIVLQSFVITIPVPGRADSIPQEQISYFAHSYVYPDGPTEATHSTYGPDQELSAWCDLLIFYGVLS